MDSTVKRTLEENPYADMRQMALDLTPEQLELTLPADDRVIYGVVMDWSLGDVIVTLTTFKTGDASIYLSSGQMFIGGVAHESVRDAGADLLRIAGRHIDNAKQAAGTELPKSELVNFYFLTNKGRFVGSESMSEIEAGSRWTELFSAANAVIAEIRKTTEK